MYSLRLFRSLIVVVVVVVVAVDAPVIRCVRPTDSAFLDGLSFLSAPPYSCQLRAEPRVCGGGALQFHSTTVAIFVSARRSALRFTRARTQTAFRCVLCAVMAVFHPEYTHTLA